MANRLVASPDEHVNYLANDRAWLTGIDEKKMHRNLIFKNRLIKSAIAIKEIVPQEECIYSMHQEFVMVYSKRKSVIPPLQDLNQEEFIRALTQCRYMFIVGAAHRGHEPLYPVDKVGDVSWIIQQSFYPSEYGGDVISVLLEIDKPIEK